MERATFQIDANTTVPQLVVLRGMADHTDSVGRGEWRALAMVMVLVRLRKRVPKHD